LRVLLRFITHRYLGSHGYISGYTATTLCDSNSIAASIGATGDVVPVEMVARYLQCMLQQHCSAPKVVPPRIACVSQPSLVDVCAGDAMEPAYILPTRLWAKQHSSDAPNPRRAQGPVTNSTKQQQKIVHFETKCLTIPQRKNQLLLIQ